MAIGERIRFFRNLRGMTQKYLGQVVGFPEKTADIRMAQYESGSRTPKADLTNKLAEVFDISPQALSVPDIDSYIDFFDIFIAVVDIEMRSVTVNIFRFELAAVMIDRAFTDHCAYRSFHKISHPFLIRRQPGFCYSCQE